MAGRSAVGISPQPKEYRDRAASEGTYLLCCVFMDFKTIISFVPLVNVSLRRGGGKEPVDFWELAPDALCRRPARRRCSKTDAKLITAEAPKGRAFIALFTFFAPPPLFFYYFF